MNHILLVDDDPVAIQALTRTLAGVGHLRFATGGKAGEPLAAREGVPSS